MGDLPTERIAESQPFSATGIDVTGSLEVKTPQNTKIYIAFCMFYDQIISFRNSVFIDKRILCECHQAVYCLRWYTSTTLLGQCQNICCGSQRHVGATQWSLSTWKLLVYDTSSSTSFLWPLGSLALNHWSTISAGQWKNKLHIESFWLYWRKLRAYSFQGP